MSSLQGKRNSRENSRGRGGKRGRDRPGSFSTPATLTTDLTPVKRKKWMDKDMTSALDAVKHGNMTLTEVAK